MRLEVDGQTLHFNGRNPAFVKRDAALWKAEPLPQAPRSMVWKSPWTGLWGVARRWVGGSSWGARADFSVGIDGKAAGDWVYCAPTFFDPLGNESSLAVSSTVLFSQPIWKVHCDAWKNERYPYPDSEVKWLGSVALPGPGEARVITPTPNLLAMLGPGHYRVAAGKITAIPAPVDAAGAAPIRFYYPYTTGNTSTAASMPELDVDGIGCSTCPAPPAWVGASQEEAPPIF